jgi:hypothetical protein
MAAFRFTYDVVNVDAPGMKQAVRLPLVQVDGKEGEKFFHCVCTNHLLKTLLVEDRFVRCFGTVSNAVCHTDILKILKQLKDDEWKRRVGQVLGNGCTRYQKAWRSKILSFPPTIEIVGPAVLNVASETFTVQLNAANKGLVMKLTTGAIEYLRAVVTVQLETGTGTATPHVRHTLDQQEQVKTGDANICWSYSRKQYRASFNPPDELGIKQARCQYYTTSMEDARTFAQTGVKNGGIAGDHAGEHQSSLELPVAGRGDEATSAVNVDRSD